MKNLNNQYLKQIHFLISHISFKNDTWHWESDSLGTNDLNSIKEFLKYKFYQIYSSSSEFPLPNINMTGPVEQLTPFLQRFNENKFWFRAEDSKLKLATNEILVNKDSQFVVIPDGQYIDGGAFAEKTSLGNESNLRKFVYLNKPKKQVDVRDSLDGNYWIAVESDKILFINDKPVVRFYFNLAPIKDGIIAWADFLSKRLDDFGIPYKLKYLVSLISYKRKDSGVLYVAQNNFSLVIPIIKELFGLFKENTQYDILRNEIPFFTREIFPGIGFAEDVYFEDQSLSFGKSRIANIVDKLLEKEAVEALKKNNFGGATESIKKSLINDGFNINEFYRNASTNYEYDFALFSAECNHTKHQFGSRTISLPQWGIKGREHFLKVAQKYANELCERAIWLNAQTCTWITYDEANDKGFHRLLNVSEKRIIRYFLYKISDFVEEKEYYNRVAKSTYPTPEEVKKDENNKKDEKREFDDEVVVKNKFIESSFIFDLLLREVADLDLKLIGGKNTNVTFEQMTEDQAILLAETLIKKFENIGRPLRNKFENFNFCPNFNGRLYVGFFFLVLHKPVAFPKFKFAPPVLDRSNEANPVK